MRVLWVVLLVLVVDQITKVWVKTTMFIGQSIPLLGDWFRLTYTENPGMAFGITIGPKPFTTVFAVLATLVLVVALWRVRHGHLGYRMSLALILGGAVGNIIDRTFYGLIFGEATLFHGQVVDFIHFNLWRGTLNLPFLGERYVALFPIWNVADMAIVVGAIAIMVFHNRFHQEETSAPGAEPEAESGAAPEQPAADAFGDPVYDEVEAKPSTFPPAPGNGRAASADEPSAQRGAHGQADPTPSHP